MKPHTAWSYPVYSPPLRDAGRPYVCRVVPYESSVHVEWKPLEGISEYELYFSLDGEHWRLSAVKSGFEHDFTGLKTDTDYFFKVVCARGESRVRLARTGKRDSTDGVTVNYLHPGDDAYAFSGRYLCSPSILRAPDGRLLASMDVFEANAPQNLTLLFESRDEGRTWRHLCELFPCFWGKLFLHRGTLYMIAVSTEYGDLLIGASHDGGKTFGPPSVLFRGACSSRENGVHKNPQTPVCHAGRLWFSMEWGSWHRGGHAAMVFSCPEDADLLDPESWLFSEPVPYDPAWPGTAKGPSSGTIEGALTVFPDGKLYNVMRYDMTKCEPDFGRALAYRVNESDPEAPLQYAFPVALSGNHSKFEIRYDEVSRCWYSIVDRIRASENKYDRNLVSLMVSRDAVHWHLALDLIDETDKDPRTTGFQYPDFCFDEGDILCLVRTAANCAHNFHDANYSVFYRIKDFRRYAEKAD